MAGVSVVGDPLADQRHGAIVLLVVPNLVLGGKNVNEFFGQSPQGTGDDLLLRHGRPFSSRHGVAFRRPPRFRSFFASASSTGIDIAKKLVVLEGSVVMPPLSSPLINCTAGFFFWVAPEKSWTSRTKSHSCDGLPG